AAFPRVAGNPAHPPALPTQYRNPAPARDAESHHPASAFADQISPRQIDQLGSDLRQPPPEPATAAQSAEVRRQTPAAVRPARPARLHGLSAHNRARARQNESPAP